MSYRQMQNICSMIKVMLTPIITPKVSEFKKPESSKKRIERILSQEEKDLLDRFAKGEIGFEEMQKEVAKRAFKKILLYPDDIQLKDWLQSELVKIKKEESRVKMTYLETFVRKMFSGQLPTHCKNCGHQLFMEGEVEDVKSDESQNLLSEA